MASVASRESLLRPAYKVQELLALRDSVSESAVSLDKFGDEEAIKEHVLKPSASYPGLSLTVENNRPSTVRTNDSIRKEVSSSGSSNKKPSPTPSIKRSKAELLLKDHGSPPGLRVTAGGRIVPVDFTPLGSPRHGHRTLNGARPYLKFGHEATHLIQANGHDMALPNGYVAYNVVGQLCQFVDGNMLPLKFTIAGPQMYLPPVNFPFPTLNSAVPEYGNFYAGNVPVAPVYSNSVAQAMDAQPAGPAPAVPVSGSANAANGSMSKPNPKALSRVASFDQGTSSNLTDQHRDIDLQISLFNEEYNRVRQEKIEYERDEIRYAGNITAAGRANIVERKKDYVIRLDTIRKQIKELNEAKENGSRVVEVVPVAPRRPALLPTAPPFKPYPAIGHTAPNIAPKHETSNSGLTVSEGNVYASGDAEFASNESKTTRNSSTGPSPPSRGTRRSHAIEIKDPRVVPNVTSKSTLDPTSPSYEPARLTTGHKVEVPPFVPPSPSPIASPKADAAIQAQYPWVFKSEKEDGSTQSRNSRHRASFSSVTTTDLFPHDTEEHSLTKYKHKGTRNSRESNVSATPTLTTPAKDHNRQNVDLSIEEPSPDYYGGKRLRAPPVSPADFRNSSFLRDVNPSPEEVRLALTAQNPIQPNDSFSSNSLISNESTSTNILSNLADQIPWGKLLANPKKQPILPRIIPFAPTAEDPPKFSIREETYQEFDGKSDVYLRGYIAGLSGQAPGTNKRHDWLEGYCAGLMKPTDGNSRLSQNTSSVSLKTESVGTKAAFPPQFAPPGLTPEVSVRMSHHSVQGPAVLQHLENTRAYSVSAIPILGSQYRAPAPYGNAQREVSRRPVPYQHVPPTAHESQPPRFRSDGPLPRSFSDGLYADPTNGSVNFRDDSGMGATYSVPTGSFLTGFSGNRVEYGPRSTSASLSHAWVSQQQDQASQPRKKDFAQLHVPAQPISQNQLSEDSSKQSVPLGDNFQSSASSPVYSPTKSISSPKRSPARKLEQLARNILSSNDGASRGPGGERRRWREGLGRRIRELQRKERQEEMVVFNANRSNIADQAPQHQ